MELLEIFFKDFIKKCPKLKGKYPPISKKKENTQITFNIKAIYSLDSERGNRIYLFKLQNPNKTPQFRYFLSIVLASQSSDLIVLIAKKLTEKSQIFLIQYPLRPKQSRLSLLCLKEIVNKEELDEFQLKLKDIYNLLQTKLHKIAELSN